MERHLKNEMESQLNDYLVEGQQTLVNEADTRRRKIAIYLRVSSDEQAKSGEGLKAQEHNIREFIAKRFPNHDPEIHVFKDEGVSASKVEMKNRPELMQLIGHSLNHRKKKLSSYDKVFDTVVVFRADRLARKTKESEHIYDSFDLSKIEVYASESGEFLNEATPQQKMIRQIVAAVSEMEVEAIKARTKAVKVRKRANGEFVGGTLPYGYYHDNTSKTIFTNDEEIKVWIRIINKFLVEGKGAKMIARELNEEGIPFTKARKRANGSQTWKHDNVLKLLKNPIICGFFPCEVTTKEMDENGKEITKHKNPLDIELIESSLLPKILKKEIWIAVCETLQAKRPEVKKNKRELSTTYLLSGLIKCSGCGSVLKGTKSGRKSKDGKEYIYYKCTETTCTSPYRSFQKERFEQHAINKIVEAIQIDDVEYKSLQQYANQRLSDSNRNTEAEIELLKQSISTEEESLRKLEKKVDGLFEEEDDLEFVRQTLKVVTPKIEGKKEVIEQAKKKLKAKYVELETQKNHEEVFLNFKKTVEYLSNALNNYNEIQVRIIRSIVLQLVDYMEVVEGELVVHYRFETGVEVPKHLASALSQNIEESILEILKGQKEISATATDFVSKVLVTHESHLRNEMPNGFLFNYLRLLLEMREEKKKQSKIALTPYVSRVYTKEVV